MKVPLTLITWNIQWGLGLDGRVDLGRIADTARQMSDFDVLCVQEVSDNFASLKGNDGSDQFETLARLLPGYQAVEGIAVDRFSPEFGRQRFGNMILSRLPIVQVFRHQLPWPAQPEFPTMPRMALEVVLRTHAGALRVTTTHLEFYSARQRMAQIDLLRMVQADACGHAKNIEQPHKAGSPFQTLAREGRAILTGDFNCTPDDQVIAQLQAPQPDGSTTYRDAWALANPGLAHPFTVGVHDGASPRCLDFMFVSADLESGVRRFEVNSQTQASDHQPLLLELDL